MNLKLKGKYTRTPEIRNKTSNTLKQKNIAPRTRHNEKYLTHRQKISNSLKGKHNSIKTEFKIGQRISPNTEFTSEKTKGKNNVNWKGGISSVYITLRQSARYVKWRTSVFRRDSYKCVKCEQGGRLHADHIKEWSKYPKLRFNINNGQTLCIKCHGGKHGIEFKK